MRSLTTRLVLAFAVTTLVSIGLAALLVRQFVVTQFDAYVLEQRQAALASELTTYYTQHGGWEGLTMEQLFDSPASDGTKPEPRGPKIVLSFADADGTVLLSPRSEERNHPADPSLLAKGTPLTIDGKTVGTIFLGQSAPLRNPDELRYLSRTDQALATAALVALVLAFLIGLLLARLITRPIRELTEATKAIAAGGLGEQVQVHSQDELGLLSQHFNSMSLDLQRATELRRRMTADIAHDLRTPLTVIAGYLEAMRDETLRPTPQRFAAMHDETQVLLRLVEDLHTLSLADAGALALKRQPLDPTQLLIRVAQTYTDLAHRHEVHLSITTPETPLKLVNADEEQLVRVLSNLVRNALRHTPPHGQVQLGAAQANYAILLTVSDTGEGIPIEHLPNIFERFYRVDPARHQETGGSGLGLAIVRSIIEAHGGQVQVQSAPGIGTTFILSLPAV